MFRFNVQIGDWLVQRANTRVLRAIGSATPTARWAVDRAAMVALPPVAPAIGLTHRVRLGRDYYVRIDSNDYSVDPRCIGRFVDVLATPTRMVASCAGQVVADHDRDWGHARTITDPEHQATARLLRQDLAARRRQASTRSHADGHVVAIRALPDYDALFGVDFDPRPDLEAVQENAIEGK
ncbi:Mu transposase domain-containing protein [Micromonospora sp. NPDC050795]|uniref:Mu transposase domain-containing protein n=1 Tax=Micromonospora sp. NPDC050795 TaxID=3364282 RepID=UPI00379D2CCC